MGPVPQTPPEARSLWPSRIAAVSVTLLVIALRLALIQNGKIGTDAREGMTAMKARHFLTEQGPDFNLRSPGDELAARMIAPALAAGDYSARAVKITALILWCLIAAAAALAARVMFNERTAWITLALMSASPTAALWAMKLRAGPVLSILSLTLALNLLFQLFTLNPEKKKTADGIAGTLGLFAGLAAVIYPGSLAAAAVLVLAALVITAMRKRWPGVIMVLAGAMMFPLILSSLAVPANVPWSPLFDPATATSVFWARLPAAALAFFTPHLDANVLGQPEQDPIAIIARGLAALVWTAAVIAAVIQNAASLPKAIKGRDFMARAVLLAAAAATFIFVTAAAFSGFAPRHFLALYPLTAILTACSLEHWARERPAMGRTVFITLIITGLAVTATLFGETKSYNPGQPAGIALDTTPAVIASLKRHEVKHVFSADPEFEWNLMFESGGEVLVRSWDPGDPCRACVEAVNEAALAGEPIAIVVPHPDLPDRRFLIDSVEDGPHAKTDWPASDAAILYGVPADYVFLYFARKGAEQ